MDLIILYIWYKSLTFSPERALRCSVDPNYELRRYIKNQHDGGSKSHSILPMWNWRLEIAWRSKNTDFRRAFRQFLGNWTPKLPRPTTSIATSYFLRWVDTVWQLDPLNYRRDFSKTLLPDIWNASKVMYPHNISYHCQYIPASALLLTSSPAPLTRFSLTYHSNSFISPSAPSFTISFSYRETEHSSCRHHSRAVVWYWRKVPPICRPM